MRAAVYRQFGGPCVVQVEDVPQPPVGPDDVLVRVEASTVSAADRRARSREVPRGLGMLAAAGLGVVRPKHQVLGMDAAGVVEAVGPRVTRFAPGDRVFAMLGGVFGGHAQYVAIAQDAAIALQPRTLSSEDAVALVFGGITARAFLAQGDVTSGTRVLVNGASGAVGTATVQLAKHAGAYVTGVSRTAGLDLVADLGADRVIDRTAEDFAAADASYDVIVDCLGDAPFDRVRHLLAPGGALLLVVTDLRGLLTAPWHTRRSGRRVRTGPGAWRAADLAHLSALADAGKLRPVRDTTFDLSDITQAHAHVDAGKKGSVVLRIPQPADASVTVSADGAHTRAEHTSREATS